MIDKIFNWLFSKKTSIKPKTIIKEQREKNYVQIQKYKPFEKTCLSKYFNGLKGLKSYEFTSLNNRQEYVKSHDFYFERGAY